jgi:hypothetical protein
MSPRILLADCNPLLLDSVFQILSHTEFNVIGLLPDGASVLHGLHDPVPKGKVRSG